MNIQVLGKRIRRIRLNKKLTIQQLAEAVNLSSNFVGQVERGISVPSLKTMINIAQVLETSIDYLVGFSKKTNLENEDVNEIIEELLTLEPSQLGIISDMIFSLKKARSREEH